MRLIILNLLIVFKVCLATEEEINILDNEETCTKEAKKLSSKEKYAKLKETLAGIRYVGNKRILPARKLSA